jgi:hypothetical protein
MGQLVGRKIMGASHRPARSPQDYVLSPKLGNAVCEKPAVQFFDS